MALRDFGEANVRFGSILLKNVFGNRPEEYFFRSMPLWRISIQELGPSDSEILHFEQWSRLPATFSTASVISGHRIRSASCPLYPQKRTWLSAVTMSALGRFCCRSLLQVFLVSDSVAVMRFATGADHDGAAQSRAGTVFLIISAR
jgi:hypothetical protein